MRVVVAGAGVFGATIALELARAGARVVLADPAPGGNASTIAAGMLAPAFECVFDQRPEHFDTLMRARDLWPEFAAGVGVEIERPGALAVSPNEARIEAWSLALDRLGVSATRLSGAEVARVCPALAEGLCGVSIDEDWRLDARKALAAILAEGSRLGVAFRRAAVTGFTPGRAEFSDGAVEEAAALVIATGASTSLNDLAPELAELTPVKGHILEVAGASIGASVVRFDGGYLCQTPGGVLLGATMEPGRTDVVIDAHEIARLREAGELIAPGLRSLPATAHAGVRAATPDGLPLVGTSAIPGVWLAVGARRNGWLLAPMVARTLPTAITSGAG